MNDSEPGIAQLWKNRGFVLAAKRTLAPGPKCREVDPLAGR